MIQFYCVSLHDDFGWEVKCFLGRVEVNVGCEPILTDRDTSSSNLDVTQDDLLPVSDLLKYC